MRVYEFGSFRLDVIGRCVRRNGEILAFPPKPFDILALLVESNGQLITKEELMRTIWEDSPVEDGNLTVGISKIRKLLGEGRQQQKYIATLPRLGYRFIASVKTVKHHQESIAVLPFENNHTDPDVEYLADGLTESLIYGLSRLSHLRVAPRNSVFQYKRKEVDIKTIALRLGVSSVVLGKVSRHRDNFTISTELLDVRCNALIWGEYYQRKMPDLLKMQNDIAREINAALEVRRSS